MLAHELHELGPVTGLADDLVPAPLEQAREALAHQHVVLSDDDPGDTLYLIHQAIIPEDPASAEAKQASGSTRVSHV